MSVRPARPGDVQAMRDIEVAAGRLFLAIGMPQVAGDEPMPAAQLVRYVQDGGAWVSTADDGRPVGYVLAHDLAAGRHLEQLSVRPDHGRQGRGRALAEAVCADAGRRGRLWVTLATFRDVPWNAPLYARWGFRELPPREWDAEPGMAAGLRAVVDAERAHGLDVRLRLVMIRWLGAAVTGTAGAPSQASRAQACRPAAEPGGTPARAPTCP